MSLFWEIAVAATKEVDKEPNFFVLLLDKLFWVVVAILILLISLVIAGYVKDIVVQRAIRNAKYEIHEEVLILLGRSVFFAIALVGCIFAFRVIDIDFAQVVGFLAVGIGFAFKDLIANIIAGVVILTQKKIKIGDLIKIGNSIGQIQEIDVRTTNVKSLDGTLLVVPNADILTNVVQNYTANTFRRFCVEVGVHFTTDLSEAIKIALQVSKQNPKIVQEPATQVIATKFDDSAIILEVRFWLENQENWFQVQSEMIQAIKIAYNQAGIIIPFPIRTISVTGDDNKIFNTSKKVVKINNIPLNTIPQTV